MMMGGGLVFGVVKGVWNGLELGGSAKRTRRMDGWMDELPIPAYMHGRDWIAWLSLWVKGEE